MTETEIRIATIDEFSERLWRELVNRAEVNYILQDGLCVDALDKTKTVLVINDVIKEMIDKISTRDKLIELLDMNFGYTREMTAVEMADYLIANGITITEKEAKGCEIN